MASLILKTFPVGLLQCNCSILGDSDSGTAIVIDPGDEAQRIADMVEKQGLRVTHILHTHAHIDHVCATSELRKLCGGEARMHKGDEWLLDNLGMQGQMIGVARPDPVSVDRWIEQGDRLDFAGSKLEVLHTPGHSPGSCTFVFEHGGRQLVFSGDTLFAGSIGRTDLWGGDPSQIMRSLHDKLMALDDDAEVVCGHGPGTTIGSERRANPFITGQMRLG